MARRFCFLLPLVALFLVSCDRPPRVFLDSPTHGSFSVGTSIHVTGGVRGLGRFVALDVNGIAVPVAATFAVDVPVAPSAIFNRITVSGQLDTGETLRDHALVIVGDGVNTGFVVDGEATVDGVALRMGDTGLGQIAPIVESLSSDALDISDLITGQNPLAQGSMSGINYTANVVEVGFGGFGLAVDTAPTGVDTDIQIDDFYLEVDLDLGWLGSCTLEVETSSANLTGSFDLAPQLQDPTLVDVNLVSAVGVALAGFSSQFVSGICDDVIIGDIINLIITQGDIQNLMQQGFVDNLADPDGSGPLDSPLAAGIETALAGISVAGPVGEALGGVLDAPISAIIEEGNGLTIAADAAIYTTAPDPDAPDLPASFSVAGDLPVFDELSPDLQLPYGMAFAISSSAMNQLLKTQIENGLLRSELTEFLGLPLTTGILATFLPELNVFPSNTPVVIRIQPTTAPILTGAPGPNGEFAQMLIGGLEVEMAFPTWPDPFLVLEVDLDAGLDLGFTTAGLEFTLATPASQDIGITVIKSVLSAPNAQLVAIFQSLFPFFAPELENAIEAFPVPSFLGLELDPVEVSRLDGGFIGLFANLTQTPTTQIQNVVFSDLSSGDFREQGGCWLREWRHRLSGSAFGNSVSANLKGMLGADAGCTTNDAFSSATLAYRVNFDIVSVPGEEWTVEVDHSILGALNRISDGYTDGIGFQDGGGDATLHGDVLGSYLVSGVGGSSGSFDFAPSAWQISDGWGGPSSSQDVEFDGTNGVTLVGTGDASIELEFQIALSAFSDSRTAFPTCNGDEMAIRLGKNDTIDNNFTAGSYPGMGGRNIADDGHLVEISLSAAPLP